MTDAQRARVETARDQWVRSLKDAWRTPQGGVIGAPAPSDYDQTSGEALADPCGSPGRARWRLPGNNTRPLAGDDPDDPDNDRDEFPESEAERARLEYIDQVSNAYRAGAPVFSDYAKSVWSAQAAIRSGSPDAADQNEALTRRMSGYEPNATAASVKAERLRYKSDGLTDAEARADRRAAFNEYLHRLENAWKGR
jgi:hypothetical protein